jgi:outer membrane protein assembly factor BamA
LSGAALAALLAFGAGAPRGRCQSAAANEKQAATKPDTRPDIRPDPLSQWQGLTVRRISFEGVNAARLAPLPGNLAQAEGAPLNAEKVRNSLRALFATGQFETIEVDGVRDGSGVDLVFRGSPRVFIGTVGVDGAKGATLNTQLDRVSQLSPGSRFTQAKLNQALAEMRDTLADNGYHEPQIAQTLTPHPADQLVDLAFHVVSGPLARVGAVTVTGDSGMSVEEFRRHAHLRSGAHVDHDTVNRALAGVLKHYRTQNRLEAEIKLEQQQYDPVTRRTNYRFSANQGPTVHVRVQGVSMSQERIRHVIPIYEEGTVDDDLLNEGNRRLRDYYQRLGFFDVKVAHQEESPSEPQPNEGGGPSTAANPASSARQVEIVFNVNLGARRRVEKVEVAGNEYFDSETLKELLSVHAADTLDHHGTYSQALVAADVTAIEAVYQNNGFSTVKVTPETSTPETVQTDTASAENPAKPERPSTAAGKAAPLTVTYRIQEGRQQKVGSVKIEGNDHIEAGQLTLLMNTIPGQLLSPRNLAGDRDALVTTYLSKGFERPQVDVTQKTDPADAAKANVVFHITEGQQVFVRGRKRWRMPSPFMPEIR